MIGSFVYCISHSPASLGATGATRGAPGLSPRRRVSKGPPRPPHPPPSSTKYGMRGSRHRSRPERQADDDPPVPPEVEIVPYFLMVVMNICIWRKIQEFARVRRTALGINEGKKNFKEK